MPGLPWAFFFFMYIPLVYYFYITTIVFYLPVVVFIPVYIYMYGLPVPMGTRYRGYDTGIPDTQVDTGVPGGGFVNFVVVAMGCGVWEPGNREPGNVGIKQHFVSTTSPNTL